MPLTEEELAGLQERVKQLRLDILDVTYWAGGAHIGGALSMAEMAVILYDKYLNIDPSKPEWEDRDRFILSKGHSGVGHAALLARKGYFEFETLQDFNKFQSPFGMHLNSKTVQGVDVSTGSLGHGLPMAVGLALGARVQGKSWRTYCLLGDGECNEGCIWEAAMAASHYRVTNLITLVDRNKFMLDGSTEEVMGLEPFAEKWRSFGFEVLDVDGHSFQELATAIELAQANQVKPVVIIADTVKGKGVDFMENSVKWHYGGLDSETLNRAKEVIRAQQPT